MSGDWQTKYDRWHDRFKPVGHPTEGEGVYHFQTNGDDQKFVQAINHHHVWSVVDGDDGGMYLCPGFRLVNLVLYVVTLVPWTDEEEDSLHDVVWHMPEEPDEEDDDGEDG